MTIYLDHVTQFVKDRDETARAYRELGFNATPGGIHKGFGSANNLCYFDLFYIEMLSIHDIDEALNGGSAVCRAAVEFIAKGNGLGGVALEADDLTVAAERLARFGAEVGEVVDMQRVQDDGFVSRSRIIYPMLAGAAVPLPIVIERNLEPGARRPMLAERGVIADHPAGQFEIDSVALTTADLEGAVRIFADGYGFAVSDRYEDEALGGNCVRFAAKRGDIVICQPNGPGRARERLDTRGPGLFAITLRAEESEALRVRFATDPEGFIPVDAVSGALIRLS